MKITPAYHVDGFDLQAVILVHFHVFAVSLLNR